MLGTPYTLYLSAVDPGHDPVSSWTINWGDGVLETVAGSAKSATYEYTTDGWKRISAFATSEDGFFQVPKDVGTMISTASAPASTDAGMPDHSSEDLLRARHAGTRILLAEDDRLDREVTQALIELVGLAVDLAESGAAAVEKAKGTDYGLILLDLQMPVMDGPEATRRIRRIHGRERTPVIALTGSVSSEVRADCLAAGMNDLVTLPVDLNLLCATMLAWLDKRTPAGGI